LQLIGLVIFYVQITIFRYLKMTDFSRNLHLLKKIKQ